MLSWRDGEIEVVLLGGERNRVKALVSPDERWAYRKAKGRYTLTHVPSGYAVWHQKRPFAFRALVRDLEAVERADWSFTDPAVLTGTPFAYNVLACIRSRVQDGRLAGKMVQRG